MLYNHQNIDFMFYFIPDVRKVVDRFVEDNPFIVCFYQFILCIRKQYKIKIMKMVVVVNVRYLSLDAIETLPKETNIQDIQDIHSDQIDSLNQTDHLDHLDHLDSLNQTESSLPAATVHFSSFHLILEFIFKYFTTIISSSFFFH